MDVDRVDAFGSEAEPALQAHQTALTGYFWIAGVWLAFFLFVNAFVLPKFIEIFSALRVDLPLPTRITLFLIAHVGVATLLLAGSACFVHYSNRRGLMIFFLIVIFAGTAIEVPSVFLPLFKIQEALRKK